MRISTPGSFDLSDNAARLLGIITGIRGEATLTSTADVSIAASSAAQVLAQNLNRRAALLRNLTANSAAFRIGDTLITATRGIELAPGETISIETTAAISAHNTGGVAQTISVLEITG